MKAILTSILVSIVLIGGAIILVRKPSDGKPVPAEVQNNVRVEDGVQIVEIRAHAGYSPRRSMAKSGIPTILRFDSKGTFDCSSSVRIPSKGISMSLDFSGSTDVPIGAQKDGILKGSCTMGMYPFEVEFRS